MNIILNICLALGCALTLVESAIYAVHRSHLRTLVRLNPPEPAEWPRVSVIVPGRDEVHTVGRALVSRLTEGYPNLELVFVDDRSTDGTADAALAAAGDDARFRLERITELPPGWLGKLNALAKGTQSTRGEWLLFSDADVFVEPGALKRAVALATAEDLDLIALVPEYRTGNFGVDVVWAAFMRMLALSLDPAKVRERGHKAAIGSGAFNLVRRDALDRSPGFEHLRMETGDDAALGQMIKESGGSIEMIDGSGCASVAVYRSIPDYIRGVEKNGSSLAGRPFLLVVLGFAALLAVEWSPVVALTSALFGSGPVWLLALSTISLIATTSCYVSALWSNTRTWLAGLFWPAGILLLVYGVLRSTWLAHRRGGVVWRGDFYPLSDLQAGRRFNL